MLKYPSPPMFRGKYSTFKLCMYSVPVKLCATTISKNQESLDNLHELEGCRIFRTLAHPLLDNIIIDLSFDVYGFNTTSQLPNYNEVRFKKLSLTLKVARMILCTFSLLVDLSTSHNTTATGNL